MTGMFSAKGRWFLPLLILIPMTGGCMSFIKDIGNILTKGGDVVTFSAVEGTVTFEGKPLVNAKIIRRVEDEDDKQEDDFATTDENGYFSMPSRYGHSKGPLQQVFAWQYMFVEKDGEQIRIWRYTKMNKDEHGELDGNKLNLICELTNDKRIWETELGSRIVTLCDLKDFNGINLMETQNGEES